MAKTHHSEQSTADAAAQVGSATPTRPATPPPPPPAPLPPVPSIPAAPARLARITADERQFRAWMLVSTSLLAIILFAVSVPLAATIYDVNLLAAFGTCLALALALPLAVRWPWVAASVSAAGLLAFALLTMNSDGWPWPWPVTSIVSQGVLLIVLGLMWEWRLGLIAWGMGVVVTFPFAFVDTGAAASMITGAAVTALACAIAVLLAQRRVIGVELFRERAHSASEQQRRVLVEERNRIARELHDVVAHGLSIIHVQATSAPYRVEGLSDAAKTEFSEIAASARSAMTEMRQLLGVLRSADTAAETAPQPGLAQLPELAASVERAGVPVTLAVDASLHDGGLAATAAYRIVQEALSNVVRHAPGAPTFVSVEVLADDLVVCIDNDAATDVPAPDAKGGGHGLIGIGERAALLGGRAEFGERPGGGYRVLATLPLGSDGGAV
ncbi:signal transduction histidine kinase [Agromyces hippuratus]|uniref:histidine kinase n=1 Tax=Agromyces hippuratus TaxID=286438 RepID=A0A852WYG9_9MICO|nr:histidine kinase [Agromyces hippuratus]NYG21290.1 signal transduction histidine kinase [Agromyces hippuratus]